MDVGFELKAEEDGLAGPLLCTFPRGHQRGMLTSKGVSFHLSSVNGNPKRRKLETSYGKVHYTGQNFGPTSKTRNLSKYAIGVFHPSDKKIRMAVIDHIYEMEQLVEDVTDEVQETPQTKEALRVKSKMMVDVFGSARRRRSMNSAIRARVKLEDSDSHIAINKAISSTEKVPVSASRISQLRPELPRFDSETLEVNKIYPIEGLLGKEQMQVLDPKMAPSLKRVGGFVSSILEAAKKLKDKKLRKSRTRMAMYLHYMLKFYSAKGGRSKMKALGRAEIPQKMQDHLIQEFSNKKTDGDEIILDMTALHKTSLVCRLCIVSLIASGFAINSASVDVLAKTLKMTAPKLKKYFREVGARVAKSVVRLKAPLTFPEHKKRSR